MKVSVVMSVYNCEKYLKDSIESILNQTYSNFEFIIINDGSTDGSIDIINKYALKDNRIIIIDNIENKGLIYSLNKGILKSTGKYVAIMDADDISENKRLELQIDYLKNNKEYDVCGVHVKIFGDIYEGEIKKKEEIYNVKEFNEKEFFRGKSIAHPGVMYKKEAIIKVGGYNSIFTKCEDRKLWIDFIQNNIKIGIIPEVLLKCRMRKESKSHIEVAEGISDIVRMKIDYIDKKYNTLKNNKSMFIWGASNGGECLKKYIGDNLKFIGYIDGIKKGYYKNEKIYSVDEALNMDYDYIFICTEGGREYAINYLKEKRKKEFKDFYVIF